MMMTGPFADWPAAMLAMTSTPFGSELRSGWPAGPVWKPASAIAAQVRAWSASTSPPVGWLQRTTIEQERSPSRRVQVMQSAGPPTSGRNPSGGV